MQTNFFSRLQELGIVGEIQLTISVTATTMRAAILPLTEKKGIDAPAIQPLNIRDATAAELDAGFFEAITRPMKKAIGLITNLEAFEKSTEKATKTTTAKTTAIAPKAPTKYAEAILKSERLEAKNLIGQAIAAMPDPKKFPAQASQITERLEALRAKHGGFSQLGIFPNADKTPAAVSPQNLENGTSAPGNEHLSGEQYHPHDEPEEDEPGEEEELDGEELLARHSDPGDEEEIESEYPDEWDEK
ncbi:PRTRC system protein E [Chitinophaga sp. NPDC101104]|uniref:PRTRC system protein E n=1 Tax=Chitinophaga sp. NPDC101104 TaxID=3390561 RepID=UPI003D0267C5